jgi:NADP-dependent 3-hydroxy acid dehydrogenase YdfG
VLAHGPGPAYTRRFHDSASQTHRRAGGRSHRSIQRHRLATARALANRGAKLVLVSRNEAILQENARDCEAEGGRAIAVAADVGRIEDMERVAEMADREFGGFDIWISNAGVAIFGTIQQISIEDHRRLFDTNYFGVLHGCLVAVRHLRQHGG